MIDSPEKTLRDKLTGMSEPPALDPDFVVDHAVRRGTRRSFLQLGSGVAALGVLAGATHLGTNVLGPRTAQPGAPGSTGPSAPVTSGPPPESNEPPTPTWSMPPVQNFPVTGPLTPDVIYRVDGNLGFSVYGERDEFAWWDLTKQEFTSGGTFTAESAASVAVNNLQGAATFVDGKNYWGTLIPQSIAETSLKLAGNSAEVIISGMAATVNKPSMKNTRFTLLYFSENPGVVEAQGPFVLTLKTTEDSEPLIVQLKP